MFSILVRYGRKEVSEVPPPHFAFSYRRMWDYYQKWQSPNHFGANPICFALEAESGRRSE